MTNCKPVSTHVCKATILHYKLCPTNKIDIKEMENVSYAQVVGYFIYTMTSTRPDISHAVGVVSRYQSNLGKAHGQAVKGIMRHLKGTKDMKLCFA